jgi:peptidoglycan/LPS O-acetylase OafA/YrhL
MGSATMPEVRVEKGRRHDIPSLDGLRALSILIVILSHTKALLPAAITRSGLFRYLIGGGLHGVQIFFVISGYLITTLLLREFRKTNAISLKRFYARRALRIFPPFYAYLALLGVLWIGGIVVEHWPTFLAAATYSVTYLPDPRGWFLMHTWSLSVEEQFYLLWPALLVWSCRGKSGAWIALGVVLAMPLVRLMLFYSSVHLVRNVERGIVTMSSADTLMVGCLLALLKGNSRWERIHRQWINAASACALAVIGLIVVPFLGVKLRAGACEPVLIALGNTITSLCIGGTLLYSVENAQSVAGRMLNLGPIRHIGVISYSLYIWQQLFTSGDFFTGPYIYLFIFAVAEASFWLIERPAQKLRARLRLQ